MPKKPDPFAVPANYDFGLDNRKDLAEALGHLCAGWAFMEFKLFGVFLSASGAPAVTSRTIFYSLRTTRARTELVSAVVHSVLGRVPEGDVDHPLTKLDKLLSKINKSANKRNAYIHDPWLSVVGHAEASVQLRLGGDGSAGELAEVAPKDLLQLAHQAFEYGKELALWVQAIDDKLRALLEIHRKQQSLALALTRRDTRPEKRPKEK